MVLGLEKQTEGQLQRGCSNLTSGQVCSLHPLFKAPSIHLGIRVPPPRLQPVPHLLLLLDWGRKKVLMLPYKGLVVWDETGHRVEQVFGQARKGEKGITRAIGEVF